MKEDESIHDFHMNILDITNASGALGEKISDAKMVRKILKYLPKGFDMKVITIEKTQDINTMKVDDLMGSFQTFEMRLGEKCEKKNYLAFVSNAESLEDKSEDLSEDLVLLGRQFKKVYQGKGVQCHECEGYGHIKAECPTYLKRHSKGQTVSWSEDESESDTETAKHVITLSGVCDEESDSEELTFDNISKAYKELCLKSIKVDKHVEDQKRIIAQLHNEKVKQRSIISELKGEVTLLNSKLDNMTRSVRMLNNRSNVLDKILQIGKNVGNNYIKPRSTSYVTFGDGSKCEIKGVGKLDHAGQPGLDNFLLVKGLIANLISISQLCDQGLKVNFNQSECVVTNGEGGVVMKGTRSKDN
ncbi:uncharacterized protein LOC131620121 [Vicia villosa]|uniref:uncharacterized protein LOC131620121 n=1 Tax=Vicia villosa TaxID=3911 RepID=UPI00273C5D5A|nr:uncharacterized protein LOC131620121 [Vicia villosa]